MIVVLAWLFLYVSVANMVSGFCSHGTVDEWWLFWWGCFSLFPWPTWWVDFVVVVLLMNDDRRCGEVVSLRLYGRHGEWLLTVWWWKWVSWSRLISYRRAPLKLQHWFGEWLIKTTATDLVNDFCSWHITQIDASAADSDNDVDDSHLHLQSCERLTYAMIKFSR